MEYKQPVSNPMLVGAIHVLKAEDSPEHRQILMDEIRKGKLLTPLVFEQSPVVDEKGKIKISPENKFKLLPIPGPDRKPFIVVFSDKYEVEEDKLPVLNKELGQVELVSINFMELANFLLSPGSQLAGFVLNPFSAGMAFPKEAVAAQFAPPPKA
jgi:hypothetical protein